MRTDKERFNILKLSLDTILNRARDIYNNTPLIASGANIKDDKPTIMYFKYSESAVVMSNLAFQSGIMRVFDSFSRISGEKSYSDKVDEIYSWYLKNGLSKQYLGYWGGHSCINMISGKPENSRTPSVLELKDAFVYMEPFYRINEEIGKNIDRATFCGAIADWDNLAFNRHIPHDKKIDYSHWFNADEFDESILGKTMNKHLLSFNTAGNDISVHMLGMYLRSGDIRACKWGIRLLKSYYAGKNEKTGLIPTLNATPWGHGLIKLEDYYGKDWFKLDEVAGGGSRSAWASVFGDRFYNQFAEDLTEQGFFGKEVLKTDLLTEKNYIGSPLDIPDTAIVFLSLAENLGENGEYITDTEIKRLAGYIEYGWIKDTPYFKKIMLDGTDLTGFMPKKNGYFGKFYNSGYKFEPVKIKANFFVALCIAYGAATDDKYNKEKKMFFEMLSYLSEKYYKVCILGANEAGDDRCSVNMDTECKYPEFVIAFVMLYNATKNIKFLDLARKIADNMIDEYFCFGLFNGYGKMKSPFFGTDNAVTETGKKGNELGNVHIGGPNSIFYTALVYLVAAVEGKYEEIEKYYPFNAFYDADYLNKQGGYEAVWDNYVWNMNNDEYEAVLRKGKEIYG